MKKVVLILAAFFLFSNFIFAQIDAGSKSQAISDMISLDAISVTIGGEFVVTGTFPASSTERVDQFVTRLFNTAKSGLLTATKDEDSFTELQKTLADYAKRGIKLIHADGSKQTIDLLKFRLTADFSQNPYLKNGDVLVFPAIDLKRNFISVEGAVNKPVLFQYIKGDKLSDALLFARGINEAYQNATIAEITRLSYNGKSEKVLKVAIKDDTTLQVGDRIRILANETEKKNYRVLVLGEVYKPGYIFISKNNTTIKEVIERAGGFRPNADLNRAEVIRTNSQFQTGDLLIDKVFDQKSDFLLMQRMSGLAIADSLNFIVDNKIRFTRADASVNFLKVLDSSSQSSKVIIRDRDIVYVPQKKNQVYVYGQVMFPSYIEYKNGKDYTYYLAKAGGLGKTAKNDVYLIKGKSRAWIDMTSTDSYSIEPGDFIWIPKDIQKNFDYYLTRTSRVAAVIGAVATLVLIFKRY